MIVSVDLDHMPAKARPTARHVDLEGVVAEIKALQMVVVHHGDEVVQAEVIGKFRRLPHRALVAFAVAHHNKGTPCLAVLLCRQCAACRDCQTVAERARGKINAGHQM